MTLLPSHCREDVRKLFDGDMTAEELIGAWQWTDGVERRGDIPHWSEREEREE